MQNRPLEVGVVLPAVGESAGGGFTFSREIVGALSDAHESLPHKIHVLAQDRQKIPALDIPVLPLGKRLRRPWISRFSDILSRARLKVDKPIPEWTVDGHPISHRLDAIVNLHPGVLEGADVLQVSTVWDLSHRYIPGLPELSHGLERRNREEKFRRITHLADFLITGTKRGAQELLNYYGVDERRIFLIPHATPADAVRLAITTENDALPRENFAIYPAQMWAHKNHVTLLHAWKLLSQEAGWNLRLVCPGHDYGNGAFLKDEARRLGISDLVEFPGFIARDELLNLYRRAGMMVYPSLFGPENLPPLEAFALGCPVVSSAIPGADEQLGDAALLVDPMDYEEWARAIKRLVSNQDLRSNLTTRGRVRALSFTSKHFANRLIAALDELAKLRRLWDKPQNLKQGTK